MKAAIADNSLSAVSERADELLLKGEIGWDPHKLFFIEEMNVRNQWQNHNSSWTKKKWSFWLATKGHTITFDPKELFRNRLKVAIY